MKKKAIIIPNWLLCLVLSLAILFGMLWGYYPLRYLDLKFYDALSRYRQTDNPSPVVIVGIDEQSIRELGPWPWPRSYLAEIINKISGGGAKAIGLHLLYPTPETMPALAEIKAIRQKLRDDPFYRNNQVTDKVDELLAQTEQDIDGDSLLTAALKPAKNIVLPLQFTWSGQKNPPQEFPGWLKKNSLEKSLPVPTPQELLADLRNPFLAFKPERRPVALIPTFPALAVMAGRHGHISFHPDSDDVLRREQLLVPYQNHLLPSFALQMALAYRDKSISDLRLLTSHDLIKSLQFDGTRIPLDFNGNLMIGFADNRFVISRYSFVDVLHDRISRGILEGKLVLIGVTDPNLVRTFRTPLEISMAPVEVTANAVENILNDNFLQRPGWAWFLDSCSLLYFGILLLYVTNLLTVRLGLLILSTFLFAWYGLALFVFMNNGLWLHVAPQTLAVVLGFSLQQLNRSLAAPAKKNDEQTEINKMLGLSFQGQGMLDMAFDSLRKCSLSDPSVKEALYNLGLDFERKRMLNKAASVYEYLLKGGTYKDANDRRWRIKRAESKSLGPSVGGRAENPVLLNNTNTRPTLGRYEIIKEIGKGAIGTVYLGLDPKINRKVAIKTLRYDEVSSEQLAEVKERFFREAEAAGRLSHPNIVTIFDVGEDYDITYMAMEYLDGHDLSSHCRKDNLLPPKVTLNIIIRAAFALDYAHKHKVVHRDIKPANIMLTEKGHVKVTDFGIARLTTADSTQTGVILGTPNYMSPEQVLGKKLDGRSDIFSLGAVFYELLTGEKPFKSNNIGNLMHNIASAKFRPLQEVKPDVPDCCVALANKMLAKSRAQRYSNAGEIVIEAQQCLEKILSTANL
jgi:CHASE2 domain-containing sensor protein/tRNA A-37 threonylcarbamoyl transferase component Bud32